MMSLFESCDFLLFADRWAVRSLRQSEAVVDGRVLQEVSEEGGVYRQTLRQLHRL